MYAENVLSGKVFEAVADVAQLLPFGLPQQRKSRCSSVLQLRH